ncbi:hypothetical protein ALI22I_02905 [Saccharothrix sp. ALI-22-I]|nr:hypothetical protein ALI22I_02905 [Saccharothrix sp. ALI-22-I]
MKDSEISLWEATTHHRIGDPLDLDATEMAISPKGHILVVATEDGVQVVDTTTRQVVSHLPPNDSRAEVSISSDARVLAVSDSIGVRLWDLDTRQALGEQIPIPQRVPHGVQPGQQDPRRGQLRAGRAVLGRGDPHPER